MILTPYHHISLLYLTITPQHRTSASNLTITYHHYTSLSYIIIIPPSRPFHYTQSHLTITSHHSTSSSHHIIMHQHTMRCHPTPIITLHRQSMSSYLIIPLIITHHRTSLSSSYLVITLQISWPLLIATLYHPSSFSCPLTHFNITPYHHFS